MPTALSDMDGGLDDEEMAAAGLGRDNAGNNAERGVGESSSRKGKGTTGLYAPPSHEEVQSLKQTGELFKSNVFKLQIDELLKEVRPAYDRATALETVLRRLKSLFDSLPSIPPQDLSAARDLLLKKKKGSVVIPFCDPLPAEDVKYKFAFEKPKDVQLIGSWPLKTAAKRPAGFDVDMVVIMPSSIFQEKDYKNYRYFHKRAYYLSVLASAIRTTKSQSIGVETAFELVDADPRRPILVLTPVKDKSDTDFSKLKCRVRIHLGVEHGTFPAARLGPMRNNVRLAGRSVSEGEDVPQPPTPRYNTSLLMDTLHIPHLVYLFNASKSCPAFADAALLLKVWAFQRGFGSGLAANEKHRRTVFGMQGARFFLIMVLAHLLVGEDGGPGKGASRPKLANGFSSYQLFRGVMDYLGEHNFAEQPVFMKMIGDTLQIQREDFTSAFDVVFVDPTGTVNLAASFPPSSFELLQHEARQTFALLNDNDNDHFADLFLQNLTASHEHFDISARVSFSQSTKRDAHDGSRVDWSSSTQHTIFNVSSLVRRALGNRATVASVLLPSTDDYLTPWSTSATRPSAASSGDEVVVALGAYLDVEQAFRLVDHGPSPEDEDAAASFRELWGPKSELRRFKDGKIVESVVWDVDRPTDRTRVPELIVRHILGHHFAIRGERVSFFSGGFAGLLEVPKSIRSRAYLADPEEKGFHTVMTVYDYLVRQLKALSEDLPLGLVNIAPAADALRFTSVFVPPAMNFDAFGTLVPDCAKYTPAHDIVLTFESSGHWPDDLEMIQKMKAAFFEKMARLVMDKVEGSLAVVALDLDANRSAIQDACALEIILPAGFAFRARIYHDRERTLLERIILDKKGTTTGKRKEAQAVLTRYERRFEERPRHHAAIAALQHRHPSLSQTVRLVRRWLAAHLLSSHVPAELIELICASVYLEPGACPPPSTGSAGFARTMRLLASWRWKDEPLLVPLYSAAGAETIGSRVFFPLAERQRSMSAFSFSRSSDPALSHRAFFVATEHDPEGQMWAFDPNFMIANRTSQLAKATVVAMDNGVESGELHVQSLFTSPLDAFDFVIHLFLSVLPRYVQNLSPDPAVWEGDVKGQGRKGKLASQSDSVYGEEIRLDFDPASEFVDLVRSKYSSALALFHDEHGGTVIGGLWNPSFLEPKEKGTSKGKKAKQQGSEEMTVKSILADMEKLGQGLIRKVEVRRP